jgi:S1-C subfamily serine protease
MIFRPHLQGSRARLFQVAVLGAGLLLSRCAAQDSADTTSQPDSAAIPAASTRTDVVENSVVKVFCTARYPDWYKPWTKQSPLELTGSGVVIEGKRILTCAHEVLHASQLRIQSNQAGDKISATVESIAPSMDMAVLKLDDETFFDTHPALQRAKKMPEIRDAVLAYGYPQGGTGLSITKGIVSRIEFVPYNFPAAGLRIQIDAAINPGNSGGPAMVGNQMIGLAFSALTRSQNIGYIIPCEEIETFLDDIKDGHYDGKPGLFVDFQSLENPALRVSLKLDKSVEGVLLVKQDGVDLPAGLEDRDIILRIGDTPIDNQGMVQAGLRVPVVFKYLVPKVARQGKLPLTVLRHGKEIGVQVPVSADFPLVISDLRGAYPSYFIYGPIAFSSATMNYVSGLAATAASGSMMTILSASGSPLVMRLGEEPTFDGEKLVVISSPFFPHKLAQGYGNPLASVVKRVNGITIKNLPHLVEVLRDSRDEFITIELGSRHAQILVFPRKNMLSATDEILTDNDIRSQGSPDTLAVWNAKPSR